MFFPSKNFWFHVYIYSFLWVDSSGNRAKVEIIRRKDFKWKQIRFNFDELVFLHISNKIWLLFYMQI